MSQDQRLIIGIRNQYDEVLKELYLLHQHETIGYVRNNQGSEEEGKEIFQRAVIAFYEKITADKDFELKSNIGVYLYSISKRIWLNELRQKRVQKRYREKEINANGEINNEFNQFEEQDQYAQRQILFWHVFKSLSTSCRELLGYYFEEIPLKKIAVKMSLSEGGIRVKKARCIKSLKQTIQKNPLYNELKK